MPVKRSTRGLPVRSKHVRERKNQRLPATNRRRSGRRKFGRWPWVSRHQPRPPVLLYFFLDGRVWDNADPAMDFVRQLDLPSRKAADALRATALDVCFLFLATPITSSTGSHSVCPAFAEENACKVKNFATIEEVRLQLGFFNTHSVELVSAHCGSSDTLRYMAIQGRWKDAR